MLDITGNAAEDRVIGGHEIPVARNAHSAISSIIFERRSVALLTLALVYLIVTGWNLNLQHVVSPDEPRYACAARHMMESGDYIVPWFNGRPRVEKPVLFHWLLVASGTIASAVGLSLTTIGFRFVPLMAGLLTVFAVFLIGERILNRRGAFISAMVLMTNLHFHNTCRELVVDMTLTAGILWSWLFFHMALERIESGRPRMFLLLGFYVSLGLASMTKGPCLVALFSTVPVVVYLAWTRRLSVLKSAGIWWGAPLALAMGLAWFQAIKVRGQNAEEFFAIENFARFLGLKDHIHYIPFFYYLISLPMLFAPWILALPFVIWWTFKSWRERRGALTDGGKLLISALGVGFFFIGMSVSKRHLYLMPIFPFLALWVGWFFERSFLPRLSLPGGNIAVWSIRAIGVVALLALGYVAAVLTRHDSTTLEIVLCGLIGVLLLVACWRAAAGWVTCNTNYIVQCFVAIALLMSFGDVSVILPIHERELNLDPFYAEVSKNLGDRSLVMYGTNSNEASWYLDRVPAPIDTILQDEMKTKFFETPNVALLLPTSFLNRSKLLKNSVKAISGEIYRFKSPYQLVVPDPAHLPDEELFNARVPVTRASIFDFL